ncbi:P-loop containing nucleoside triphosphate hydrolase [Pseudocohnilembus persalinus]|uniref:RNA helicase n=1 Tax=Pseudocohnilembus persalinus TaxID=266149 RepID=A0A0V0QXD0_PSEPJ|nr:P-loop containing nucleoside triphosphate hydrolase [Pseudocohnilembus persalinus]|eukprot:KRX07065.1 P-loop containing nucleoside triphosphate hydrolase [Pseudocohnilembus persalinus]
MSSRYQGSSSSRYRDSSRERSNYSSKPSNRYGGGGSEHRGGYHSSSAGSHHHHHSSSQHQHSSSTGGYQGNNNYNNNNYNNNNSGSRYPPRVNNNNQSTLGDNLRDVDWSRQQLAPFTKVFYKEGQSKRSSEEVEKFRKEKEVIIKEAYCKVPNPFISWDETYFPPYIMNEIKNAGFPNPTAIQSQAFPIILSGHDFIGIAKTGSGKTLSFLLPSVVHINAQPPVKKGDGPIVLVISPTRELACQIQDEIQKFGASSQLSSTCVYGGADKYKQMDDLRKGVDILIATPGRLIEFLEKKETNLSRVTYLCLDEADRMLDMGFEKQIRKILGQIRPDKQTVMFSATWPKEVQGLAKDFCLEEPIYIQIGNYQNTVNTDIRQVCEVLGQAQKNERLVKYLCTMKSSDKVLIFTQTKKQCEMVSQSLRYERFPAIPIHGDKSQGERDAAIEAFKNGQCRILIATDVASRGLDIKNVTFVINYDMPKLIENYIHRIGRTGRAGASGTSVSFLTYDEDKKIAIELLDVMEEAKQEVPQELRELAQAGRNDITRKNQYNNAKRAMKKQGDTWDTSSNNVFKQFKDKYSYLAHGGQQQQKPYYPNQQAGNGSYSSQTPGQNGYNMPPPQQQNGFSGPPPPQFNYAQQQQPSTSQVPAQSSQQSYQQKYGYQPNKFQSGFQAQPQSQPQPQENQF